MVSTTLIVCSFVVLCAGAVSGQPNSRHGKIRCGPVCAIHCEHGNVMHNGCPTCRCNPAPMTSCPRGSTQVRPTQRCSSVGPWIGSNSQCGTGAFCSTKTWSLGGGICCRSSIILPVPHCPPNDIISTCEIKPNSCSDHSQCPMNMKCCSRGCGKVCVNAFGQGYFPGSIGTAA